MGNVRSIPFAIAFFYTAVALSAGASMDVVRLSGVIAMMVEARPIQRASALFAQSLLSFHHEINELNARHLGGLTCLCKVFTAKRSH